MSRKTREKSGVQLDQYKPPQGMVLSEHLRVLSRPPHRYGEQPSPKVKTWECNNTSQGEFQEEKEAKARLAVREKEAITKWLRKGQDGGVEGIAKELNRSLTYCRERLRGFETTRGQHRWNEQGDKLLNSSHSSRASTIL
mmetsp:Transcript_15500/g.29837  ORF Transcript_15500/g.29837 Transcript_15500/m.29837 type:complete len:140 (+) Transcript_15500:130-549(+)